MRTQTRGEGDQSGRPKEPLRGSGEGCWIGGGGVWWTKLGRSRDDVGRRGPGAARASGTGAGAVAQAITVSN